MTAAKPGDVADDERSVDKLDRALQALLLEVDVSIVDDLRSITEAALHEVAETTAPGRLWLAQRKKTEELAAALVEAREQRDRAERKLEQISLLTVYPVGGDIVRGMESVVDVLDLRRALAGKGE